MLIKKILLVVLCSIVLPVMARDILQVESKLSFNDKVVMKSPFIVVLGDTSTLAEEGREGYKVIMSADAHMDNSYTLHNEIYNYGGAGFNLLSNESIKLSLNKKGVIEFSHKDAGKVKLELEVVKKVSADVNENFNQPVR